MFSIVTEAVVFLMCVHGLSGTAQQQPMVVAQVRVVVERLARRLGYDEVAAAIPEEHRKLLTHIRKQKTKKLKLDKAEQARCSCLPLLATADCCTVCCEYKLLLHVLVPGLALGTFWSACAQSIVLVSILLEFELVLSVASSVGGWYLLYAFGVS